MRTILVLAQNLEVDSEVAECAARIGRASCAQVICLSLVSSYASTAELIQSQPDTVMRELRELQGRQTTAEWVHTLEKLRSKQWETTDRQKKELKTYFESRGVPFHCHVIEFDSVNFLKKLKELMPVDLLIAEKLRFPRDLTARGIVTLGDLGARFSCPAIDVDVMRHFLQPVSGAVYHRLSLYGLGTLLLFSLVYFNSADISRFLMGGGVIPAAAVMGAIAAVAWTYGRAIQSLLKAVKLDIY